MGLQTALIVGAGLGLSASVARKCHEREMTVALAARDTVKLSALSEEIDAKCYTCDVRDPSSVIDLFSALDVETGPPNFVLYNPSLVFYIPHNHRNDYIFLSF